MGDPFKGGVPLDGNGKGGPAGPPMGGAITCLWHSHNLAHPPDAPECFNRMHLGKPIRVVPLPAMLAWLVVNLTQMLTITEGMAEHLNEVALHVEALDLLLESDSD